MQIETNDFRHLNLFTSAVFFSRNKYFICLPFSTFSTRIADILPRFSSKFHTKKKNNEIETHKVKNNVRSDARARDDVEGVLSV